MCTNDETGLALKQKYQAKKQKTKKKTKKKPKPKNKQKPIQNQPVSVFQIFRIYL